MRYLIITQAFWPDTVSTAQHLMDLAVHLKENGHEVDVFTSINAYEDPSVKFSKKEIRQGIKIKRIRNTSFGKGFVFGRLLDFISFNLILFFRLIFIKRRRYDAFIGMTSPPLVSFIGVIVAKFKKIRFYYWAMDLQPELAITSGLIKKGSTLASIMTAMGNHIIVNSDGIIALDKYMKEYLIKRGAKASSVAVIPVWPVMDQVFRGNRKDNPFRKMQGFQDKIVIMYSGNHSVVHPLDTLLEAAKFLQVDERFLFVFIGGGVRKKDVTTFKHLHSLNNIIQLPYQPREEIHFSLGSSDIQVVILGENQVGYTHPNKVYGAMFISKPILYIGPLTSHITDILNNCPGNISVAHGQHQLLVENLLWFASLSDSEKEQIGQINESYALANFLPIDLKNKMLSQLSSQSI